MYWFQASARTRIDAFLYRAAAMLPANKQMVLNVEFKLTPVPAPTVSCSEAVLVGFLDYTIVVTDPQTAGGLCSPLFVTEPVPE